MAKRIIVLEKQDNAYRVAFWADVPAARQPYYAATGKKSAWSGASAGENTAIETGAVVEMLDTVSVPPGATLPQMQAILIDRWTAYQADVTARNPWVRLGTYWDGTSWTAGGVA